MSDNSHAGTICEQKAAIKLLELGYEVFQSIVPSSKIDLLVRTERNIWVKIQVKKAIKNGLYYGVHICHYVGSAIKNNKKTYQKDDVDYFIAVRESDFYIIPFNVVEKSAVTIQFALSREFLNRWDLLPNPYCQSVRKENIDNQLQLVI